MSTHDELELLKEIRDEMKAQFEKLSRCIRKINAETKVIINEQQRMASIIAEQSQMCAKRLKECHVAHRTNNGCKQCSECVQEEVSKDRSNDYLWACGAVGEEK